MKKKSVFLLISALAITLAACGPNKAAEAVKESEEIEKEGKKSEGEEATSEETEDISEEEEKVKVGILLPEEGTKDQEYLAQKFEEAGYATEILIADQDADMQIEQFHTLVEGDAAAIVIDPVDAYGMTEALASIDEEEAVPVFAYDTLIRNTEFVKYYTAFDTRAAGHKVGEEIVKMKNLEKAREEKSSYTIEFLMGTPEDVTELFFYNGILEVLQEYLDDKTLVCKSEKVTFDDTSVMRGSDVTAKNKLEAIMDEFYEGNSPDIICTSSDAYTMAILEFLETRDYTMENGNLPLITGFGGSADTVKAVAEGKVGFTLFQDRSELADVCLKMVDGVLTGEKAKVDNYSQYDNGKKIIGTYTCEAKLVDKDNYQFMIDNGTYTEEEIMPEIPEPTPTPEEEAVVTGTPVPEEEASAEETTVTGTPTPEAKDQKTDMTGNSTVEL